MGAARTPQPKRLIAWIEPAQADLVRALAASGPFTIVGAGSPVRAQTGAVSQALACPPIDDLRIALTEADTNAVLIGAPGDFRRAEVASDAPALLAARARGVRVATLEPFPVGAIDLATRGWLDSGQGTRPADVARLIPLSRHSAPFRDAAELIASLGQPRTIAVESLSPPSEGSLAARLLGAIDTVLHLAGEPETIDAAYVSPNQAPGMHALPGEHLADLHGDITANLRFADGRAASILASNHAARWSTRCTILTSRGRLTLHDTGFELLAPDGRTIDESAPKRATKSHPALPLAVQVIGHTLSRLLDPHIPDPGPPDWPALLSIAQAALLSARTGQPESPNTFRSMMGGV